MRCGTCTSQGVPKGTDTFKSFIIKKLYHLREFISCITVQVCTISNGGHIFRSIFDKEKLSKFDNLGILLKGKGNQDTVCHTRKITFIEPILKVRGKF